MSKYFNLNNRNTTHVKMNGVQLIQDLEKSTVLHSYIEEKISDE